MNFGEHNVFVVSHSQDSKRLQLFCHSHWRSMRNATEQFLLLISSFLHVDSIVFAFLVLLALLFFIIFVIMLVQS